MPSWSFHQYFSRLPYSVDIGCRPGRTFIGGQDIEWRSAPDAHADSAKCEYPLRLVNQILDFRKYENGKMEYTPVTVDVLSSFEGWNESFQAAARKKHIHFLLIVCRIRIIIHWQTWRSWNVFISISCPMPLSLHRKTENSHPSVFP